MDLDKMAGMVAFRAKVNGRVQGVYYRAFTRQSADRLGIRGYARNLRDGSVEVYAEGDRKQLDRLLSNLKQGPPAARVDRVEITWLDYTGGYRDFSVTV
jgi:acylphosphatase